MDFTRFFFLSCVLRCSRRVEKPEPASLQRVSWLPMSSQWIRDARCVRSGKGLADRPGFGDGAREMGSIQDVMNILAPQAYLRGHQACDLEVPREFMSVERVPDFMRELSPHGSKCVLVNIHPARIETPRTALSILGAAIFAGCVVKVSDTQHFVALIPEGEGDSRRILRVCDMDGATLMSVGVCCRKLASEPHEFACIAIAPFD